jgi:hypothetical protein
MDTSKMTDEELHAARKKLLTNPHDPAKLNNQYIEENDKESQGRRQRRQKPPQEEIIFEDVITPPKKS